MTCQCLTPQIVERPSGTRVCVNESCGGRVVTVQSGKKARP